MRFKLDENLPVELAELLVDAGHEAQTVAQEVLTGCTDRVLADVCRREKRAFITFDLDFSDIRAYPPVKFAGLLVLRLRLHDTDSLLAIFRKVLPFLDQEPLAQRLWIVEETRVRVYGEDAANGTSSLRRL